MFLRKQSNLLRAHCTEELRVYRIGKGRTCLQVEKRESAEDATLSLQVRLAATGATEHIGATHDRLPRIETVMVDGSQHAVLLVSLVQNRLISAAFALAAHFLLRHLERRISLHLAPNPLRLRILSLLISRAQQSFSQCQHRINGGTFR